MMRNAVKHRKKLRNAFFNYKSDFEHNKVTGLRQSGCLLSAGDQEPGAGSWPLFKEVTPNR